MDYDIYNVYLICRYSLINWFLGTKLNDYIFAKQMETSQGFKISIQQ